jgi:ATP-dependent RNA helicase DeaD
MTSTIANDDLVAPPPGDGDRNGDGDGFATLGLDTRVLQALSGLGYEEPTPVQREAIPPLLAGRDVLGEAPTGTGKTAAFALPIVQRLAAARDGDGVGRDGRDGSLPRDVRPRAVVLVPTRELAMQVAEAIHRYGLPFGTRVLPIYGGQGYGQQLRGLRRGVDVVVATPGRMVDHLDRGTLALERIEVVVLDEADEMLDMGFAEDLDRILSAMPSEHQTALFSATISPRIAAVARRHLRDPVRVSIAAPRRDRSDAAAVRQVAYVVRRPDKPAALGRILDLEDPSSTLVFARTREEVEELADRLVAQGHDAAAIHGGMTQEQRDRVMGRFRDRSLDVLVATDVAARGLDIEHVSHVVNYDIPSNPDSYVHRIGRTGRAGREGVAITLVEPREHRLLRDIERATRTRLELGRIPTVAHIRERRLELLRATLREAVLEDASDPYRAVVEPLTEEFDLVDIALAAVRLAAEATRRDGDTDEADIPEATLFDPSRRESGPRAAGPRGAGPRGGPWRGDVDPRGSTPRGARPSDGGPPRRPRGDGAGWTRLFVGAGRRAGMRPGDLVGAITHEAGIGGSAVGAIQIADGFSIVEVSEDAADRVVEALRGATIRGRKVPVRRDRD